MRLVFPDRSWLQSLAGSELIAVLEQHATIESVRRHKSTLHVRFDDEVLAERERHLAAGGPGVLDAEDLFAGERITVSYLGPNTNKALHVGHLRNIVMGEALASACVAAGTTVRRHNLVGDIGRRVGEAMAGYLTFHKDESPATEGLPGDRFVELCSSEYSNELIRSGREGHDDDPNAEERKIFNDLADTLMTEWLGGVDSEVQLWRRMRDWVLEGHRDTLARLGVRMDHLDFESDAIPRAIALAEEGVDRGIFEREETGGVVYRTDRSEYPTLVLIREDGFPTEHARLLGVYDHILEDLAPGEPYLEIAGIEWRPVITLLRDLLEKLRPGSRNETDMRLFHASVTSADGEKIGSSVGGVVWIDDFLDDVAAGPGVSALQELGGGAVGREELADILVRATFLCAPTSRSLAFTQRALIEGRPGPGWTIAEAWCQAQHADEQEGELMPVARTAVMQSQHYRRSLRRTVEKHDIASLSHHLLSLSEAYLAAPNPGPSAVPVLRRVLNGLGFLAGRSGAGAGAAESAVASAAGAGPA